MATRKVYEEGWTSQPEKEDRTYEYKIIRTPPRGIRGYRVISNEPLGRYTHHWKGRTVPCVDKDCLACKSKNFRRWYGWIFVIQKTTEEIALFEYTKAAAGAIRRYYERNRTLKGAHLEAWRKDQKQNGAVTVTLRVPGDLELPVPKAPDRKKFLAKLWETNIKITSHFEPADCQSENTAVEKANGRQVPIVEMKKA